MVAGRDRARRGRRCVSPHNQLAIADLDALSVAAVHCVIPEQVCHVLQRAYVVYGDQFQLGGVHDQLECGPADATEAVYRYLRYHPTFLSFMLVPDRTLGAFSQSLLSRLSLARV